MTTIKLPCTCRSEFQDEQYGQGIRLHNVTMKQDTVKKEIGGRVTAARCTVCGTDKKNL